jgi:gamma-glutamyl-gamma-aminobutyrate hydrolase PuuD
MWAAISQRNLHNGSGSDVLENAYVNYFEGFGVKLIPIPNISQDIGFYFEELPVNAVILSGGNDINPELYNQKPVYVRDLSALRDNTERRLLELAIEKRLPVLGICRGMQFINVFFGGTIIQNIRAQCGREVEHVAAGHGVCIDHSRSRSHNKTSIVVNSYHNQGINKACLSPELKAFAHSEKDGLIEGIYHRNYPIAGIQWHPERPGSTVEYDKELMNAFISRQSFWSGK